MAAAATRASRPDPETITVWTQWNQAEADEVKKVAQEFEAANPGVTVTVETRATDPHKEALRVSLNTDAAPDVFQMWGGVGLGGFYVGSGGVEPLTDTYTALGWQDRFLPNAVALSTFDGTVYGAPDNIHGMGLYYRKDLFDKAGITAVPTTYDELVAANQKLVAAGITPLSGAGKFGWMTMRLIDSLLELKCGADVHDQLVARTASWDQACVTDGIHGAPSLGQREVDHRRLHGARSGRRRAPAARVRRSGRHGLRR